MTLYHGSTVRIEQPLAHVGREDLDFGQGFYLSDNENQAQEMAEFKAMQLGGDPIISRFEFDDTIMSDASLKVLRFEEYSEEWADFVLKNRDGVATEKYDIVYGPIANDKVGLQIRKLKDGSIDKKEFLNRLKYMKGITFQYFFGSKNAISHLKKI